ncbi:MAG: leucyl aminopeptidase [Bacteroidales bacterium]|nr:leucyl aminopeptidase [Bacteroidales bacterium]
MRTKLSNIDKIRPDVSIIYLMNETSDLNELILSKPEQAYVQECIRANKKLIQIHQYYRYMFFYVINNDNDKYSILEKIRRESSTIADKLNDERIKEVQIVNALNEAEYSLACAEGLLLSNYKFDKYITKEKSENNEIEQIYLVDFKNVKQLETLLNVCDAVFFTRDLINEPANVLNSIYLAEKAKEIAQEHQLFIHIYFKPDIEAMGMGGLLAVNRGSVDPPVFIHIEYKPQQINNQKPIVFVGKGITFDSGGLNLKPGDSMDGMKSDMSGAAAVLGILKAAASNQLPLHIIGLIPATDNRPGFNAFAPGDIIRMMDGSTVEMLNSDAEGRMILADALHYAKQFTPELVIDIATLTGSASAAVGRNATVAFVKTSEDIFRKLEESAFETWERIVRFPLWDDYADMLKSKIADMKNIGNRHAGAITAAKFLEHFTDYPWIHLDIAGPAFLTEKDSYRGVGGTGVCVRLLHRFLEKW